MSCKHRPGLSEESKSRDEDMVGIYAKPPVSWQYGARRSAFVSCGYLAGSKRDCALELTGALGILRHVGLNCFFIYFQNMVRREPVAFSPCPASNFVC
jgi:hypothetical protein